MYTARFSKIMFASYTSFSPLQILCTFSSPIIHLVNQLGSSANNLHDAGMLPRSLPIWSYSLRAASISTSTSASSTMLIVPI
ncbi:hypothetical protein C1H46_045233 [Malus baccata]|uniref:Uncharacterized protein n=1 Tax=Malus baccata TaxID=106549 RepID=A0A540K4T1_MALBA|nr:hypothetical protein C1H46_045233 [Malus baccata]